MERILTVPSVIKHREKYLLTGNHYVSLPKILPDGEIKSLTLLSGRLSALMDFRCSIRPVLVVGEQETAYKEGRYSHDFIPVFSASEGGVKSELLYAAPEDIHGFTCRVRLSSDTEVKVTAGFDILVSSVHREIFHGYPLEGRISFMKYSWTDTLVCELINGYSLGGFGVSCTGADITVSEDSGALRVSAMLGPGEEKTLLFHFSVGSETDGTGLVNMDMRRRGEAPLKALMETLNARHRKLSDPVLERYANFNMNFCLYYSCGYTYDTDEFCMLTSRSPAYYVSSAFWSRDCFLWAFPGILYADAAIARKILLTGFSRYINNIGIHALYIDGRVLYPGFELDELVAPVIALERYVSFTGDCDIMHLPAVKHGLECIREELARHFSPGLGLYSTELDPSDDPAEYRYLTYDNVLCAKALEFLGAEDEARAVRAAIGRHCVTEIGGDRIYAWGTDGDGQTAYDDPPGSLLLLPFYGFCDRDDPVYVRTAECIFSDSNPNFYKNGSLFGTGCDHTPFPWPVSLINLLLGRGYGSDAVASLRIMAEAAPLACESVNPVDGGLNTGDAFATMAGFLAAGIFDSL